MSTSMFEGFIIVTNRRLCEGDFLAKIDALARTEARAIILREKDLGEAQYRTLAEKVLAICRAHGKPCLLHSHVKMAEEMGADGVHLPLPLLLQAAAKEGEESSGLCVPSPQEEGQATKPSTFPLVGICGLPLWGRWHAVGVTEEVPQQGVSFEANFVLDCARAVEGCSQGSKPFLIGASVHSVEEARLAEAAGASYLLAGHVFETDCKRGLPGRGLGFLEEVSRAVKIPVYGLGGLSPEHLSALRARGAAGGAIMSLAMQG